MTCPFRLFQLPSLALEEVFKNLRLLDQYTMVSASRKCHLALRDYFHRSKLVTQLNFKFGANFEYQVFHETRGRNDRNGFYSNHDFNGNDIQSYKDLVQHLTGLLSKPVVYLYITNICPVAALQILIFVKTLNIDVKLLTIQFNSTCDMLVKQTLNDFNEVEKLSILCNTSESFNYSTDKKFKNKLLKIYFGDWITIRHLTEVFNECERVELTNSSLSSENLKTFFCHWIKGESCIDHFEIVNSVVGSLTPFMESVPTAKRVEAEEINGFSFPGDCYSIQQSNGKTAIVYEVFIGHIKMSTSIKL